MAQIFFWTITQPFFVLEQTFIKATRYKKGKIIGVSEVNFYSKILFATIKKNLKNPTNLTTLKKG